MRQTISGGITLDYPNALIMAFNPVLFHVSGGVVNMKIALTANGKTYELDIADTNGECWADVEQYVQTLFDGVVTGIIDYTQPAGAATTFLPVSAQVDAKIDENTTVTFNVTFSAVWGAMTPAKKETWNGYRRVTWFANYPFTFGAYAPQLTTIQVGSNTYNVNSEGIYDLVPVDNGLSSIQVYDLGGVIQQGVFDSTFDITFQAISGGGDPSLLGTIDIDRTVDEGIYLRWINRHGFSAYWLFKVGDEQHSVAQVIAACRANYAVYRERYGYSGASGERGAMSREDIVPLCVPLVDKDTWEYLQDVATSPVVDMFVGLDENNAPQWVNVAIQAATYTKTRDELQDFVVNLLPPQTPLQRL